METEDLRTKKYTENTQGIDVHKILLIGNNKNKDTALSTTLRRNGYHVVYCDSVTKAWNLIYPHRPDVIIMRLHARGTSASAEFQECRALAEGVPIVLMIDGQVDRTLMAALHHSAVAVVPDSSSADTITVALHRL